MLRLALGFVAGAENRVGPAVSAAVVVGAEDPPFAGGSDVVVPSTLHDRPA